MSHDTPDRLSALVINLSPESDAGDNSPEAMKFVVIDHEGRLVLVHGSLKEYPYHASLIHEYCESHDLAAAWLKKPDVIEIYHPEVAIRGGGWLEFDQHARRVSIYGFSTAYGKYSASDVRHILQSSDCFNGYRITLKS
jgi:hypothetical protein